MARFQQEDENNWISISDIMTGLMVIFMLLAISYVLKNNPPVDVIIQAVYSEMERSMKEDFDKVNNVIISDEATVRFIAEKGELFKVNEHELTPYFKKSLDKIIPIYFEKLKKIYSDSTESVVIKEVRIEGHTDSYGNYYSNLNLSSNRAREVQEYIMRHPEYLKMDWKFRVFLKQNFIACGYSFSKMLDSQGRRTDDISKEDKDKSRRVEFRVLLEYKRD